MFCFNIRVSLHCEFLKITPCWKKQKCRHHQAQVSTPSGRIMYSLLESHPITISVSSCRRSVVCSYLFPTAFSAHGLFCLWCVNFSLCCKLVIKLDIVFHYELEIFFWCIILHPIYYSNLSKVGHECWASPLDLSSVVKAFAIRSFLVLTLDIPGIEAEHMRYRSHLPIYKGHL